MSILLIQEIATMNTEGQTPQWGFFSPDGLFLPVSGLNTDNLEYASTSNAQLEILLQEYIASERYEQCAVIRDELLRRQQLNQ